MTYSLSISRRGPVRSSSFRKRTGRNWSKLQRTLPSLFFCHPITTALSKKNGIPCRKYLHESMTIYIQCKTISRWRHLPWMTADRKKTKRKHVMYKKAKSTGKKRNMVKFQLGRIILTRCSRSSTPSTSTTSVLEAWKTETLDPSGNM